MGIEEKASWTDTDWSNVENALKKIAEKEAVFGETAQNDKKKEDSAKAAEMRNWELWRTLAGHRKDKGKMR